MPFAYGRIYHERSCQKANLEKEFFINSAGTSGEHDGEGMHYGTKNKLAQLNIEHKNFTSKNSLKSFAMKAIF